MEGDPRRRASLGARSTLIVLGAGIALAVASLAWYVLADEPRAIYLDPAHADQRVAYLQPDADLGYAPPPGRTVRALRRRNGRVVYDVLYTIGNDGLRATPGNPHAPAFLFFGDSCAFGEGVEDDETTPVAFARALAVPGNVRNFGFHGYGPHQTVRELEVGRVDALVPNGVRHAFYSDLPAHGARAAGRAPWDVTGPRYVVDDAAAGGVRFTGPFHAAPVSWLLSAVNHIPPLRTLREILYHRPPNAAERELHARLLARAGALVRERFRAPLTVVHWDDGSPDDELFLARLAELGVDFRRVSEVIPLDRRAALAIPDDGHPTPSAHLRLGLWLAHEYGR